MDERPSCQRSQSKKLIRQLKGQAPIANGEKKAPLANAGKGLAPIANG